MTMDPEDAATKLMRLAQEGRVGILLRELKAQLKPHEGATLFLFDVGEAGGSFSYASTANRDDIRRLLAEFLHKTGGLPEAVAAYIDEQIANAKMAP